MNPKSKKISRWVNIIAWSIVGFFLLGYMPTVLLNSPVGSMPAAAICVIPYASKLARPLRAAVVGGALGLIAGIGIANALFSNVSLSGQNLTYFCAYVAATAGLCAAVGLLFGYMGRQRHRMMEQEWEERTD